MAGKGRGLAAFSFHVESLGITRGSMPESRVGPNPLFPDVEFKPVPLKVGDDEDYMLALKQEMRGTMRQLPHSIKPLKPKADVERYKEKYQRERQKLLDGDWTPDWNLFPKELMPQKKKLLVKTAAKKKPIKVSVKDKEQVLSQLDELEKRDNVQSDEEKEAKKEKEGEEEEVEAEELEDEEQEEENDYIASYFEDGDDFDAGSDDNMDEATY
ncbi:DNA-directed RNA polymerase III subunit RPC7 isoform X1 [Osmerus eperlanus]|uniref:DNA-directed RNA polymerase III subunit RPC7 isoform X1 n=1 Tax=Osmerus eperlanus TaxID=29151 RepID=UPI002E0EC646